MGRTWLVTGPPRSGKTTALRRTVAHLGDAGWRVEGVYAPEVRDDGQRVGFDLARVDGPDRVRMAARSRSTGPRVGAYRVDVDAIDALIDTVMDRATAADVVAIDEVGPMQLHSQRFVAAVRSVLTGPRPVLATVQERVAVDRLPDLVEGDLPEPIEVDEPTRDQLPARLAREIHAQLERDRA